MDVLILIYDSTRLTPDSRTRSY